MDINIGGTLFYGCKHSKPTHRMLRAVQGVLDAMEKRMRDLENLHTSGGFRKPMNHQPLKDRVTALEENVYDLMGKEPEPAPEPHLKDRPGMEWVVQCGGGVGAVPVRVLRELVDLFGTCDWWAILAKAKAITDNREAQASFESDLVALSDYLMENYQGQAFGVSPRIAAQAVIERLEENLKAAASRANHWRNKGAEDAQAAREEVTALQEALDMSHAKREKEWGKAHTLIQELRGSLSEAARGNTVFQGRVGKAIRFIEEQKTSHSIALLEILKGEADGEPPVVPPPGEREEPLTTMSELADLRARVIPEGKSVHGIGVPIEAITLTERDCIDAIEGKPETEEVVTNWKEAYLQNQDLIVEALRRMFQPGARDQANLAFLEELRDILDPAEKGNPLPLIPDKTEEEAAP